jgi:16S rRNA (guanine527-N7)-methyltransferase
VSAASDAKPAGDAELGDLLSAGAVTLALPLAAAQIASLVAYVRLIAKWNATYNLTAIREPRAMVTYHLLDCLAAARALFERRGHPASERVLDVGSGAGLPGIVIGVVAPERTILCVDSVGKKAAFITEAAAAMRLTNVRARHERVENLSERFDVVASRAFASLPAFVDATRHLLADDGVWMAMKGKTPEAELAGSSGVTFHVEPLDVPGLDAERCVVWMSPSHEKRAHAYD